MAFRIFVSSTFLDLRPEREAVQHVLQGLQNIYAGMEFFGPRDEPPLETSLREVSASNVYLGIFSERYGTIDPATGQSITELEYRRAMELKLPCLIFFRVPDCVPKDSYCWESDPVGRAKLDLLKQELSTNHTPAYFKTADDLATQVAMYLPRTIATFSAQTKGIPPPFPPGYFVGREAEIAALRERLTTGGTRSVACVCGMGGIGKTALVQTYAYRYAADFPDGIFWLPFARREPNSLLQDLAQAIGEDVNKYTDLETRAGAVRALLFGKRALLIYDDVTDSDIQVLATLRMPCATLITTRLMNLSSIDPRDMFELDSLKDNEALELCGEILGSARVNTDIEGASELCKATGNLPLALVISLRVLFNNPYLSVFEYAANLRDQSRVLKELTRGDDKNLNVRASFDLSYKALSDEDKQRFRRLAIFASGEFELVFVAAVTSGLPEGKADEAQEAVQLVSEIYGKWSYQ